MKTFFVKSLVLALLASFVCLLNVSAQNVRKHVVERGETLASIAGKYKTTKGAIVKLNPEAAQFVYVGMELQIPEGEVLAPQNSRVEQGNQKEQKVTMSHAVEKTYAKESRVLTGSYGDYLMMGRDVYFEYAPQGKSYGVGFDIDINKYFAVHYDMSSDFKFGKNDFSQTQGFIGVGVHQRYFFNDLLMIGVNLFPYGGLCGYDELNMSKANGKEFKTEFIYGASASLKMGFKLFANKNGNDALLSVGYSVYADKFKTQNLFKSGYITVGYSIIIP